MATPEEQAAAISAAQIAVNEGWFSNLADQRIAAAIKNAMPVDDAPTNATLEPPPRFRRGWCIDSGKLAHSDNREDFNLVMQSWAYSYDDKNSKYDLAAVGGSGQIQPNVSGTPQADDNGVLWFVRSGRQAFLRVNVPYGDGSGIRENSGGSRPKLRMESHLRFGFDLQFGSQWNDRDNPSRNGHGVALWQMMPHTDKLHKLIEQDPESGPDNALLKQTRLGLWTQSGEDRPQFRFAFNGDSDAATTTHEDFEVNEGHNLGVYPVGNETYRFVVEVKFAIHGRGYYRVTIDGAEVLNRQGITTCRGNVPKTDLAAATMPWFGLYSGTMSDGLQVGYGNMFIDEMR